MKIIIQNAVFPLKIVEEKRRDIRYSVTKTGVFLRLPIGISLAERQKQMGLLEHWLKLQVEKTPRLALPFSRKIYGDGDTVSTYNKDYLLRIKYLADTKMVEGKRIKQEIFLTLPMACLEGEHTKSVRQILSKIIAADQLPALKRRVAELNHLYFKAKYTAVRLKYVQTLWGSCSSKGTVNFSSRLLLTPPDVRDYVIIHELAHLQEFNHSPRFWKLVADAMPNYAEKEEWLHTKGRDLDF